MHIHNCSLLLKSVEDRDSGSYRIFAINSEGSAECTASLLVALREEQNLKYLDFVRYSEKTHESIDSLVQKRREARLKVDLRCVGSPHDKRRETQVLRSQYPKKGIVRTISFENLSSISSHDRSKKVKQSRSERLLDKEIHQKLQRLQEIKRGKRERGSVSVSSSEAYSDIDLESFLSDTSSTSFHIEKDKCMFATSSEISSYADTRYKGDLSKSPVVQDKIRKSTQQPSETYFTGLPEKDHKEIQLHRPEILSIISTSTSHEFFMKEKKESLHLDVQEEPKLVDVESCSDKTFNNIIGTPTENDELKLELPILIETKITAESNVESGMKKDEIETESTSVEISHPCPPMFTCDIDSLEVCEGQVCTFTCRFRGYPQPTISWYNNDKSIPRNEDYVISSTESKSTLTFNCVNPKHEGSVTCVIFNQYGTDTTFGNLKVKKEDRDTAETLIKCKVLISKHFNEGEEEELVSLFESTKEKKKIVRNTGRFDLQLPGVSYDIPCKSEVSLSLPVEIKITAPTPILEYEEVKEYSQSAEVPPESPDSVSQKMKHKFTFSFDVANKAPRIIQEIEKQVDCKEGDSVLLKCIVSGDPNPAVTWYRNNTTLDRSRKFSFQEVDGVCELFIKDVSTLDSGAYKCVAKNRAGEVESVSKLIVHDASYNSFIPDIDDQKAVMHNTREIENLQGQWESSISDSVEIANNEREYFVKQNAPNVKSVSQVEHEKSKSSRSKTEVESNVPKLIVDSRTSTFSGENLEPIVKHHKNEKIAGIKEEIIGDIPIDQSQSEWESSFGLSSGIDHNERAYSVTQKEQTENIASQEEFKEQKSSISMKKIDLYLPKLKADTLISELLSEKQASKIQPCKYDKKAEMEEIVTRPSHVDQSQSSFDHSKEIIDIEDPACQHTQNVSNVRECILKEHKPVISIRKEDAFMQDIKKSKLSDLEPVSKKQNCKFEIQSEINEEIKQTIDITQSVLQSQTESPSKHIDHSRKPKHDEIKYSEEHKAFIPVKDTATSLPTFISDIRESEIAIEKPVPKIQHYKSKKETKIEKEITRIGHIDQSHSQRDSSFALKEISEKEKSTMGCDVSNRSIASQEELEEHKPSILMNEEDLNLPKLISDNKSELSNKNLILKTQHNNLKEGAEIQKELLISIREDQSHSQREAFLDNKAEIPDQERLLRYHDVFNLSNIKQEELKKYKPSIECKVEDATLPTLISDIKELELSNKKSISKMEQKFEEESVIQKEITISNHDDPSRSKKEAYFDHSAVILDEQRVSKSHKELNVSNVCQGTLEEYKPYIPSKQEDLNLQILISDVKDSELLNVKSVSNIKNDKYEEEIVTKIENKCSIHDNQNQQEASLKYSKDVAKVDNKYPINQHEPGICTVKQELVDKSSISMEDVHLNISPLSDIRKSELSTEKSEIQHDKYEKQNKIEIIGVTHADQGYISEIKETENTEEPKELPTIPKRKHSVVKPQYAPEIESKIIEEPVKNLSVAKHQSSIIKEMEHTDARKELPAIPKRRRSLVKTKSGAETESKSVEEEAILISPNVDQRSVISGAGIIETRKELPTPPRRKRSISKTKPETDTVSIPTEGRLIKSENAFVENQLKDNVCEPNHMQPSQDREFLNQIHISETGNQPSAKSDLHGKEAAWLEKQIGTKEEQSKENALLDPPFKAFGDICEKDVKESLEMCISKKVEVVCVGDDIADHETKGQVKHQTSLDAKVLLNQSAQNVEGKQMSKDNDSKTYSTDNRILLPMTELVPKDNTLGLKETTETDQPLLISPNVSRNEGFVYKSNEPTSKTAISGFDECFTEEQKSRFSLTEYLVSAGEQEIVIPAKEDPKEHITTLEVEDVTFSAFYDFYKNQSLINRSLSPESEISIKAGSVPSEDLLDLDQFYTPPSSVERFPSPLSEGFQTPPTSPEHYFTPVQQMFDSNDVKIPNPAERAATMSKQLVETGEIESEMPPAFTKPFPKKCVYENNMLTFAVEITGLPAPDVKWYRNSLLLKSNERIKIENRGSMYVLEILNIQLNEGGLYMCHAINTLGEAKRVTQVEVLSQEGRSIALPPPVTLQHVMEFDMEPYTTSRSPSPQEILLEVELDESAVQDFEKQVKIITIPEFSPDSKSMVISLDVLPLAFDEQGLCTNIRDSEDVKIKFEATEIPPRFLLPLSNLNIPAKSDVEFKCSVVGLPRPTVKWYKENKTIFPDVRKYLIKEEDKQYKLLIYGVNRSDVGTYVCKAENNFGEVSCKAFLSVIDGDVCAVQEKSKESLADDKGMVKDFDLQVDSTVPKGSQAEIELEFELNGDASDANKALKLVAVSEQECVEPGETFININVDLFAKPSAGKEIEFKAEDTESCSFEFQVTEAPPKFKIELLDQTVLLGKSAYFQCAVTGSPLPSTTWYKDGEIIQGDKYMIEEETPGFHKLTIRNIDMNDEGRYKCVASNKERIVESNAFLKVRLIT